MRELALGALRNGFDFVCIGDAKTPSDWVLEGCKFISYEDQRDGAFELGAKLPVGHYSRKNVGYLSAYANRAEVIIETDDDNAPLDVFYDRPNAHLVGRAGGVGQWLNAYAAFSEDFIWPRGLPLEQVLKATESARGLNGGSVSKYCPVQQGLANGDSDVDAVYRMTRGQSVSFAPRVPLILQKGVWCPFNSQSTTWFESVFDMMYLPSYCSFRMTDIWRSFVVQACLWANDWCLAFTGPTVYQDRNPHNLFRDFEAEVPGYLNNQRIVDGFNSLALCAGREMVRDNVRVCYRYLVELGLIDEKELILLEAWFSDINVAREIRAR